MTEITLTSDLLTVHLQGVDSMRHPEKALAIHLVDQQYVKLVVEVESTVVTALVIQAAIHQ